MHVGGGKFFNQLSLSQCNKENNINNDSNNIRYLYINIICLLFVNFEYSNL